MKINYRLAKELKDAGFPFVKIDAGMCVGSREETIDFNPMGNKKIRIQHFFIPTLSELITECKNGFQYLIKNVITYDDGSPVGYDDRIFLAIKKISDNKEIYGEGNSPEEAVANLWLKLNKK